MKPLNKFELWVISIITNDRYYLVMADDEEVLENARHMRADDMISIFSSVKSSIEKALNVKISTSIDRVQDDKPKKKSRKTVKKVAKKHE
jgi:hypothetical protein